MLVIEFVDLAAALADRVQLLKLRIEERGANLAGDVRRSNVHPGVLIHHATEEAAAISAFFANDFGTLDESRRIDAQRAPFPADVVLRFVEAESGKMADRA